MTDDICFIKTTDVETANLLKSQGLSLLCQRNGKYIFVVPKNLTHSYVENKSCHLTDTLCF